MESSYGVGVKNRFDLFIDDENDPLDVIAETEKRKQQDKAVKKDTKSSKKVNETKTIENVKGSSKNEGDKRDGEQGEKKTGKTDHEKRGPPTGSRDRDRNAIAPRYNNERREQKVAFTDSTEPRSSETKVEDREQSDRPFNDRGTGRGRGRARGGMFRNRREFEGRGKREFDRRSGSDKSTYRGPNEKREGAGPHNWGSMADDAGEGEVFDDTTSSEQEKTTDWAAASEEAEKAAGAKESTTEGTNVEGGEESAAGEEDGAKQMTLDEYKAEQKKLRMKADFKLRKASEGEDSHKWAKAVPFQRNDDFVSDRAKLDDADADKGHKSGRVKETIPDIRIRFNDPPPSRGRGRGRGENDFRGRGSGRGRGGNFGRRQNSDRNQASVTPNFENQDDFPALSGN